jgi:hypothetical protein
MGCVGGTMHLCVDFRPNSALPGWAEVWSRPSRPLGCQERGEIDRTPEACDSSDFCRPIQDLSFVLSGFVSCGEYGLKERGFGFFVHHCGVNVCKAGFG